MSSSVLDASALLALFYREPGHGLVETAVTTGASISTINLSEVIARLVTDGLAQSRIRREMEAMGLQVIEFDLEQAYLAASLRPRTRQAGLSLGDRACLALAQRLSLPALIADRAWEALSLDVTVQLIR